MDDLSARFTVETLFVNDGSRDQTEALLNDTFKDNPNVRVVSHETNRGLGAALRTGFKHATGDIIVTTDFDGTYDFANIPQLIDQLLDEKVDIVTASPYHPQGTRRWRSEVPPAVSASGRRCSTACW